GAVVADLPESAGFFFNFGSTGVVAVDFLVDEFAAVDGDLAGDLVVVELVVRAVRTSSPTAAGEQEPYSRQGRNGRGGQLLAGVLGPVGHRCGLRVVNLSRTT